MSVFVRRSMPKISHLHDDPSGKSEQVPMKANASGCLPRRQRIPPQLRDPRLELCGLDAMPRVPPAGSNCALAAGA